LVAVLMPATASAHDSAMRIDQDVAITIGDEAIVIEYARKMNRQAAANREMALLDLNGDGVPSPEELQVYFPRLDASLAAGLELSVNGAEIPLTQIDQPAMSMDPGPDEFLGSNDDRFVRIYRFEVPHPSGWRNGAVVELHNDNYLDLPGSLTITLDPGDVADVVCVSLGPDENAETAEALAYAGLPSDPQQRDVLFRYRRGAGRLALPGDDASAWWNVAPAADDDHTAAAVRSGHTTKAIAVVWAVLLLGTGLVAVVRGFVLGKPAVRLAAAAVAAIGLTAVVVKIWYVELPRRWARRAAIPSDEEAGRIFRELHGDIYAAFKAETESKLYDVLAGALEGDELRRTYTEIYDAMVMRNEGLRRDRIRRIKPLATDVLPADDVGEPAFRVRYRWRVYAVITHLNHTHCRVNECQAIYLVRHNGHAWRIVDTAILEDERVAIDST